MKTLIVIDMQNDFVTGSLANPAAEAIIPFIKAECESGKYDKIIFTKDTHYDNYLLNGIVPSEEKLERIEQLHARGVAKRQMGVYEKLDPATEA